MEKKEFVKVYMPLYIPAVAKWYEMSMAKSSGEYINPDLAKQIVADYRVAILEWQAKHKVGYELVRIPNDDPVCHE